MEWNLSGKTEGFFDAFKEILNSIVSITEEFYNTIKGFVDGFKKEFTADEPWKD